MALFRDCLRVSIVADIGEGKVFGPILDSSNPTMTMVIEECGVEDGLKIEHRQRDNTVLLLYRC
jgi:hypothetical protein